VKDSTEIPAVFDCNILIQATTNSRNPASACFRLVENKVVKLFVSEKTLQELEEVLNRPYIKIVSNLPMKLSENFYTKCVIQLRS